MNRPPPHLMAAIMETFHPFNSFSNEIEETEIANDPNRIVSNKTRSVYVVNKIEGLAQVCRHHCYAILCFRRIRELTLRNIRVNISWGLGSIAAAEAYLSHIYLLQTEGFRPLAIHASLVRGGSCNDPTPVDENVWDRRLSVYPPRHGAEVCRLQVEIFIGRFARGQNRTQRLR
ncbi:hypothetical protein EVAR_99387_1 [Eumeta japonica]|uniref:Uncharacterized protein n=1 Tax=Eumeta variegata TaxID=151549 RepID=A0A4C1SHU1_EUMVA|nr:hypothetical protein EVAR_99387_1 [Eumeta japonica]